MSKLKLVITAIMLCWLSAMPSFAAPSNGPVIEVPHYHGTISRDNNGYKKGTYKAAEKTAEDFLKSTKDKSSKMLRNSQRYIKSTFQAAKKLPWRNIAVSGAKKAAVGAGATAATATAPAWGTAIAVVAGIVGTAFTVKEVYDYVIE